MNLISKEGWEIGYDLGATMSPLDYMNQSNPKTQIFPKGFRQLLVETCPLACYELKQGRKVYGFRTQDIIEQNFNQRTHW